MVPNHGTYNASQIDWTELHALARHVAAGTHAQPNPAVRYRDGSRVVQAIGTHWLLDSRSHHITTSHDGAVHRTEEQSHEQYLYVLLPDGSLRLAVVTTTEVNVLEGGALLWRNSGIEHSSWEFSEAEVLMFDFEEKNQYFPEAWGNRERGDVLLFDVKGAGLSKALSDLQVGHRASLPSPLPPLEIPVTPSSSAGSAAPRSRASEEWSKKQDRRARVRRNDRIFDKVVGAFKGGAVGLLLWWILALTIGLVAGFGVVVVILAAVVGAVLE